MTQKAVILMLFLCLLCTALLRDETSWVWQCNYAAVICAIIGFLVEREP